MKKLLTIAIAAYNKEKELPKCLDSIIVSPELQQLVQVLVVNDGSKDRTHDVAKEYEAKYPGYITTVDQTNGNYGKVMNTALSLAEGKYFRTLDGDDWYDTVSYVKFLQILSETDADMIITEKYVHFEKDDSQKYEELVGVEYGSDMSLEDAVKKYDCFKTRINVHHLAYKTSIVKKSGLKWIEKICYTDTLFDFWPLPLVKTIRFEKLPVYVYLLGTAEQSMSAANIRKNHSHFVKIAAEMIPYFENNYLPTSAFFKPFKTLMNQILYCVNSDLLYDGDNVEAVKRIYDMLSVIPEYQKEIKENTTFRGCKYLASAIDNRFSIRLSIIRILKRLFR